MILYRSTLLILCLLILSSCRWFTDAGLPHIAGVNIQIPEGTPSFRLGYKHGCELIFYSRGNIFYRMRYKYNYDPTKNGDPEYRFGYSRGRTYCFNYIIYGASGPVGSFDMFLFPYKDSNGYVYGGFGADDYNNTVGGMFSGLGAPIQDNPANGFDAIFDVLQKGGGGSNSQTTFGGNPLWAGGSAGQFFGQ